MSIGGFVLDINLTIANNIKNAREERKLTLDSAASITGVSRSMLTQIEKGDVNPTISILWKIANGYKISFTSLMEKLGENDIFIPCTSPITEEANSKYYNFPTFPFDDEKLFEMYRIVIEVDGYLEAQPHLAFSEEYITVFEGSVEIMLENTRYILNQGDSLRFKADQKHSYRNIGDKTASLSMLISYGK